MERSKSTKLEAHRDERDFSRRRFLRNAGVGVAIPALGLALDACGGSSNSGAGGKKSAGGGSGNNPFPSPGYQFTLVNHVTTNSFFVPTQSGAKDACTLLGCSYQWTGSQKSVVTEMVDAMNTAIDRGVAGIGIPIIDPKAFNDPTDKALSAGIPVIAYNASAPAGSGNNNLGYIGQDLFQAGVRAGQHILKFVKPGDLVAGFIATPGALNLQPRIDGASSVLKAAGISLQEVATGAVQGAEIPAVQAWYEGHQNVKFMYAVGSGESIAVATASRKNGLKAKGINGSGWDLAFTIDQQAYTQGFMTIVELFLYQVSGGLLRPSPIDTGLLFVDKTNIGPYLANQDRYEGSSTAEKILKAPSAIKAT